MANSNRQQHTTPVGRRAEPIPRNNPAEHGTQQHTTPIGRRDEIGANVPMGTRRGNVPIRRNVEDYNDPYIPDGSYQGTVVCRECQAVFQTDHWTLDAKICAEALRAGEVHYVTCPGCLKLQDRQPGGIVTMTSDFIPTHREEILNLIRNEDARARNINPLERVMEVQENGDQMVVTTTNEKLAQRIGRAMHRAYKGQVHYQWLSESKQARVWWAR